MLRKILTVNVLHQEGYNERTKIKLLTCLASSLEVWVPELSSNSDWIIRTKVCEFISVKCEIYCSD